MEEGNDLVTDGIGDQQNVDIIELSDKTVYLVGTAHVSKQSVELVQKVIETAQPDAVAIELCESRYNSLKDPDRWKNMDLYTVIKQGKTYVLLAQLVLASYQKKLGKQLEVAPGAEMMQAMKSAELINAKIVLADRDIKTTLRRTWNSISFFSMLKIVCAMFCGNFSNEQFTIEDIEKLKSSDALEELMKDFSKTLPQVRTALIDERDQYLSQKIAKAEANKLVAVVGAGHVPGIKKWIHEDIDLARLDQIPPTRPVTRLIGWGIPLLIVVLIALPFINGDLKAGLDKINIWCMVTAATAAFGALVSLAHPLTILVAALSAPITTIHPVLASGMFAGLVEALIRKPKVSDLETITDDIVTLKGIWRNRVSRILLVVILTNIFGSLGTFLGMYLLF